MQCASFLFHSFEVSRTSLALFGIACGPRSRYCAGAIGPNFTVSASRGSRSVDNDRNGGGMQPMSRARPSQYGTYRSKSGKSGRTFRYSA